MSEPQATTVWHWREYVCRYEPDERGEWWWFAYREGRTEPTDGAKTLDALTAQLGRHGYCPADMLAIDAEGHHARTDAVRRARMARRELRAQEIRS